MNTKLIYTLPLVAVMSVTAGAAMAKDHGKGDRPEFADLDTNTDGFIDAAELQAHAAAKFAEMDADNNGSLTVEEITAKAGDNERRKKRATRRAERMIERMDGNHDNALTAEEMKISERAEKMIDRLDEDDDGKISQEEFDAKKGKRGGRKCKRDPEE